MAKIKLDIEPDPRVGLIGISSQFKVPTARYVLVGLGSAILAFSIALLLTTPSPPA